MTISIITQISAMLTRQLVISASLLVPHLSLAVPLTNMQPYAVCLSDKCVCMHVPVCDCVWVGAS